MKYGPSAWSDLRPCYREVTDGFALMTAAMIVSSDEITKLGLVLDRWCNEFMSSLTEGERRYYDALVSVGTPRLDAIVEARRLCRKYYRPSSL